MLRKCFPAARSILRSAPRYNHDISADYSSDVFNRETKIREEAGKVPVAYYPNRSSLSAVTLCVRAGSAFENVENNGANNFLQHLAFSVGQQQIHNFNILLTSPPFFNRIHHQTDKVFMKEYN